MAVSYAVSDLVVRNLQDDEDVVVPSFLCQNNTCAIPLMGIERKLKQQEMFKASWSRVAVKDLS